MFRKHESGHGCLDELSSAAFDRGQRGATSSIHIHECSCESGLSALDWKTAMKLFYLAAVLLGLCDSIAHAQWQQQIIHSDADFRGLCAVSAQLAGGSAPQ